MSHTETVRICIRCQQPITFDWLVYPVVDDRTHMHTIATFYGHPNAEACENELARVRALDHGESPSPRDIGMQRAAYLRALLSAARVALEDQVAARRELALEQFPAAQELPGRQRGHTSPYGGLL